MQLQVLRERAGLSNPGEPVGRQRGGRMKGRQDHTQSPGDWRTAFPFLGAVSSRHAGQRQRSQVGELSLEALPHACVVRVEKV